jgi:hypothetical protein
MMAQLDVKEMKFLVPENYNFQKLNLLKRACVQELGEPEAIAYAKDKIEEDCYRAYIEHSDHTVTLLYDHTNHANRASEEKKRQKAIENIDSHLVDMKEGESFCVSMTSDTAHFIFYKKANNFVVVKYCGDEFYWENIRRTIHQKFHAENITLQEAKNYLKRNCHNNSVMFTFNDFGMEPKHFGCKCHEDKQQVANELKNIDDDVGSYLRNLPDHSSIDFYHPNDPLLPHDINVLIIKKIKEDHFRIEYFKDSN